MNVVVVGLGSMGRRRIRQLKKYDKNINIYGVDINVNRRELSREEYGINVEEDLENVLVNYEINCAFVCTSPLSHSGIITQCLKGGIHVFSELNLVVDEYDKNIKLANEKKLVLFLSSTMLYRKEIKEMHEMVSGSKCKLNYSYHVGQYLPDWHPWESYNDFFVGDKRTNGCREILAIELPWIVEVFGHIKKVDVVKDKMSSLNIDYNDNYLITLQHISGHKGFLLVDVVSRKPVRRLEVYGEDLYLTWCGSPESLLWFDIEQKKEIKVNLYDEIEQQEGYNQSIIENAYFDEIVSFFEEISGSNRSIYSFEKDKIVLNYIDEIEG